MSLGRLYLKMAFRPDFSNQTLVRIHSTLQRDSSTTDRSGNSQTQDFYLVR